MSRVSAKVDVIVFTYNHAPFIADALRSILAQRTAFDVAIRIHDDASTDDTVAVIEAELKDAGIAWSVERAPVNRYSQGFGFVHEFMAASDAEYLAMLDGDDFWIDDGKLQAQVELMDAAPGVALVHHPVMESADGVQTLIEWPPAPYREPLIDGDRLAAMNIISTSSVLLRRTAFPARLPEGLDRLSMADYPLWALTTAGHQIAFIDRPMSAYRVHGTNLWANLSLEERQDRELDAKIYIANALPEPHRGAWRQGIRDSARYGWVPAGPGPDPLPRRVLRRLKRMLRPPSTQESS